MKTDNIECEKCNDSGYILFSERETYPVEHTTIEKIPCFVCEKGKVFKKRLDKKEVCCELGS